MTKALRILAAYLMGGVAGFAIYVALFAVPIGGEILFYRGILLALIAAVLLGAFLALAIRQIELDLATRIGIVLTSLAANICFLVLFPVTIDRSISVFLLSRIAAEQPMSAEQLQGRFADEYLGRMNQIPRRVREQEASGNIFVGRDGLIHLSDRGRTFVTLAKAASGWFHTDPRFVDPTARSDDAEPSAKGVSLGKK